MLFLAFATLQIASTIPPNYLIDHTEVLSTQFPSADMGLEFEHKIPHGDADIHLGYKLMSDDLIQVNFQLNRNTEANPIQFSYQYHIRSNPDGSSDMEAIGILRPNTFYVSEEAQIKTNKPGLIHYPSTMKVGTTLPDATFNYTIVSPNVEFVHAGEVLERKVLKSFTATYKGQQLKGHIISAKVISEASLNNNPFQQTTTLLKEWFVPGLGMVKQERRIDTQPIGFVDNHKKQEELETTTLKNLKLNL